LEGLGIPLKQFLNGERMRVDRAVIHALVSRELSRNGGSISDIHSFCATITSLYIREKQLAYAEFVPIVDEIKTELLAGTEED